MKRLALGIDCDGVIAAFDQRFQAISREIFGKPAGSAFVPHTRWDWNDLGITAGEIDVIWRRIRSTKNFWLTLGKERGTESLKEASLEFDLYFITHRVPTVGLSITVQTAAWIKNNYDIPFPQVIPTQAKGEVAKALKIYAYIDDKPENVVEVAAATSRETTFVCDRGYNRGEEMASYPRVATLDDFITLITERRKRDAC